LTYKDKKYGYFSSLDIIKTCDGGKEEVLQRILSSGLRHLLEAVEGVEVDEVRDSRAFQGGQASSIQSVFLGLVRALYD